MHTGKTGTQISFKGVLLKDLATPACGDIEIFMWLNFEECLLSF